MLRSTELDYSWPHTDHTDRRLGILWGHVEFVQKTRGKGEWISGNWCGRAFGGFFLVLVDPFQKDGSEEKGEKGERERKRKEKEKKESKRRNGGRKNEGTGENASSFCCFCCLYLYRSLTRVLLNCFLRRPPATNFARVAPPYRT